MWAKATAPRGVRGHASLENFEILHCLRLILRQSGYQNGINQNKSFACKKNYKTQDFPKIDSPTAINTTNKFISN